MTSHLHTTSLIPEGKKSVRPCPRTFLVTIQQGHYPIQSHELTTKHPNASIRHGRRSPGPSLSNPNKIQQRQNQPKQARLPPIHHPRSRAPPRAGSSHHPPIHETPHPHGGGCSSRKPEPKNPSTKKPASRPATRARHRAPNARQIPAEHNREGTGQSPRCRSPTPRRRAPASQPTQALPPPKPPSFPPQMVTSKVTRRRSRRAPNQQPRGAAATRAAALDPPAICRTRPCVRWKSGCGSVARIWGRVMVPALSVPTQLGLREATATPGFGITRGREGEERTDACAHSQVSTGQAGSCKSAMRWDGLVGLIRSPRGGTAAACAGSRGRHGSSTQLRALQRAVRSILGKKYRIDCSVAK
jgi:hypothetical protein